MKHILKTVAWTIAAIPFLFLAECMYRQIAEPSQLASVCAAIAPDTSVRQVLAKVATNTSLRARTGGPAGKDDIEWFDREYLRYADYLRAKMEPADEYTVVFAKPGLGYYACVIIHRGDAAKAAWFEDNSS
jgi:hypothetical protein